MFENGQVRGWFLFLAPVRCAAMTTPLSRPGARGVSEAGRDVFLPLPDKSIYSMEIESDDLTVSVACMQGWRTSMEDAHAIHLNLIPGVHLIAVCDGHGGTETAQRVAENLGNWILRSPHLAAGRYEEALRDAYVSGDAEICALQTQTGKFSGTTAISVLITKNKIYCANVGDSRAVLCRGTKAVELSEDHKPTLKREYDRVLAAGGQILNGRVRGMLAMTRALGDAMLKRADVRPDSLAVTPIPEISVTEICDDDVAIVMACDGIWDCITNQEVCQFFTEESQEHDDWALMCENLCHALVAPALHQFGTDNMTLATIRFRRNRTPNGLAV